MTCHLCPEPAVVVDLGGVSLCGQHARERLCSVSADARARRAVQKVEAVEQAWREAVESLPAGSMAPVRIGADSAREVDPADVGSVLAVLRARAAGGAR